MSGERIVTVDGIKLNIREHGEGQHIVLCLPGLIGTIGTDFGHIFDKIDRSKFRLICWDPPGYGISRPYERNHEGDFYARDAHIAVKLMDKLGYSKFSILGWSNGGMTGAAIAAEFPERVSKLVMWGAHAFNDREVLVRALSLENTQNWSEAMLQEKLKIYDSKYLKDTLKNWADSVRKFYASGEVMRVNERCPKIQCPTLVLHGAKDPLITIKHAKYFVEHAQNCQMRVVHGAEHNLHLTHTSEFLNLVEPFLLTSSFINPT